MQESQSGRTNRERTKETMEALIAAARTLFVARGYAETGTPEIVATAGVTRGALYHHFADKKALFRAVVEAEMSAVAAEVEAATRQDRSAFAALIEGGEAFLAAMARPGRTRLILIDGPAVIGWADLAAMDRRHGGRTLEEGLAAAMQAGEIRTLPLGPLTTMLSALYDRAALDLELGTGMEDIRLVLRAVMEGLRAG